MAISQFGSGGGGTSSTVGAAYPTVATAVGFVDSGGNLAGGNLDPSGYLEVNVKAGGSTPSPPSTSTLTNISASTSNQTALAANANRLGALFTNDSDTNLVLKYGVTSSSSSFSVGIPPGEQWRLAVGEYSGRVDVIWIQDSGASSPSGALRVTETSP